jgi:hypothetical protein
LNLFIELFQKAKLFEQFTIPRRIAGAKEWDDGFEELRAIEHSFAVTFTDGESPWLFYVDTNELKVSLLTSFCCVTVSDLMHDA